MFFFSKRGLHIHESPFFQIIFRNLQTTADSYQRKDDPMVVLREKVLRSTVL